MEGERQPAARTPRNVTSVGGVVVGPRGLLLVRMAYGPTKGLFMFPGGLVEPGETLDDAVVREVREETAVTARPLGICAVRTRHDGPDNDTYVMFSVEPVAGEPVSDGRENDEARYLTLEELDRDDVTELSRYIGRRAIAGDFPLLTFSDDFDWARSGRDPKSWRLFR